MSQDNSGHDWWHIERVRKMALKMAEKEGGDKFIIEIAALLHDIDDYKLVSGNADLRKASAWLKKSGLPEKTISHVLTVIGEVSFKGNGVEDSTTSIEAEIVQDADRLDAMGAIGIARAFAYGGSKSRLIYDPAEKPAVYHSFEDYKKNKGSTVNHFYEKLLLLKDRMNTTTAKAIAESRHDYMVNYLKQFFNEWNVGL